MPQQRRRMGSFVLSQSAALDIRMLPAACASATSGTGHFTFKGRNIYTHIYLRTVYIVVLILLNIKNLFAPCSEQHIVDGARAIASLAPLRPVGI